MLWQLSVTPLLFGWPWRRVHYFRNDLLQWRNNDLEGVSNHQPHDCLFIRFFRRRSTKTSKLRVTGLSEGISPGTSEFPAQRASNAEKVSIWWRHFPTLCALWNALNEWYGPVLRKYIVWRYTPFTHGLRPLCLRCATIKLSRSPLKAQKR